MNLMKNRYWWIVIILGTIVIIFIWFIKKGEKKTIFQETEQIRKLRQEVARTCNQVHDSLKVFQEKFPESTNEALKSEEWTTAMGWTQACDTAKADLEETLQSQTPAQK